MWFSSIAGILVSLAVSAGFGYVLGGLWLAVLLPAAEIVFMAIAHCPWRAAPEADRALGIRVAER